MKVLWGLRRSHPRKERAQGLQTVKVGAKAPGYTFPGAEKICDDGKG